MTVIDRAEQTRWGATVGAGVEYTFAPNWSFGFDYSHLFIGTENYNFRGVGTFAGVNVRHDDIKQGADIVTTRVNYRFGARSWRTLISQGLCETERPKAISRSLLCVADLA